MTAAALAEREPDAGRRRGGAVLAVAAEVEVAVAPGMQPRRAAERLSGPNGTALAGVVYEGDGAAEAALQLAQLASMPTRGPALGRKEVRVE